MPLREEDFASTSRFEILRRLGSGGFGVVYEAHDRERNERVALKTIRWTDPAAIYGLKKEFRALADVVHNNLVSLYELIVQDDSCFYTMELIAGTDFTNAVRMHGLAVDRLRATLRQVAEGVAAIHAVGKLHRDLKPSNVLVTPVGRAVILDFGIVREITPHDGALETIEDGAWGTAAYMAPEQVTGQANEASDWYAIGAMLYEALTGRLPYTGSSFAILSSKHATDPSPPQAIAPGLPEDLAALCMRLLARNAGDRPSGPEILRALGSRAGTTGRKTPSAGLDLAVVGRESQLASLDAAFTAAERGAATSVYVQGESGIGKTTLVQRFLDRLAHTANPLLLAGRCYVRESVPYKGFDGVVDSLSRYLRTLSEDDVAQLLPGNVWALTRLFPVLARVDAISRLAERSMETRDALELRRHAFSALHALLTRIRASRPVVIWIDDFQWGDADTVLLLDDLLGPPAPPALLFIATLRTEEIAARPFLRSLLERPRSDRFRELHVEPIASAATRELARAMLGPGMPTADARAATIAREAAGSPFLVEQLVRFILTSDEHTATSGITLVDMVNARLARLPAGARPLLETVATAGRPISVRVAADATGLGGDARALFALLSAEQFLRPTATSDHFELYHDRLREPLAGHLDRPRLATLHVQLAEAMEAHGADDPEALYEHYAAAGRRDRAAVYAGQSAERAARSLAFERAAAFYKLALELAAGAGAALDLRSFRVGLADALANAGRGAEAAQAYLAAADAPDETESFELRRRAAEQLLCCGHVDRGLAVLEAVLTGVGLRLARSPRRALLRLLWRRALLRLRGLSFAECPEERIPRPVLRRIDVCWGVAIGLARVDNIRAANFQSLNLLFSLQAGEPYRIARALAAEHGFVSTAGEPALRRAMQLERVTRELADRIQHPHALGMAEFATGVARFYIGRFAEARAHCEAAEEIFRQRCTGAAWETNTAQTFSLDSLCYLGEWRELMRRVPLRLREARERDDLYAAADVAAGRANLAWLVADDAEGARTALHEAIGRWSLQGFHAQHFFSLLALGDTELYAGEGDAAWFRTMARWRDITQSMLMRIQVIRIEASCLRARSALAVASDPGKRHRCLESATRDARRIARERTAWGAPIADLVFAGVAAMRRDERAVVHAERAAAAFEACGMMSHAAVARRRHGELIGGDAGATLVANADASMRSRGVVNPDRICAMLAPGFSS